MIVAIIKSNYAPVEGNSYHEFIHAVFREIVLHHTSHQFVFIGNWNFADTKPFATNVSFIKETRPARGLLTLKWWHQFRLPALMKKCKVDILITADGGCSPAVKIPQCVLLHEPVITSQKVKRNFLQKAGAIIMFSDRMKSELEKTNPLLAIKASVIPVAVSKTYCTANEAQKQQIKKKYTGGREYFICSNVSTAENNLLNVIKAFSVFKRMQQSGMKLVLAGKLDAKDKLFSESLASYKYRDDVVIIGSLPAELRAGLLASAYALINPGSTDQTDIATLEAAQSGVPAITTKHSLFAGSEAFLLADIKDHTDLAAQMMLLYKDEALRNRLIQKGKEVAGNYDMDKTASLLWSVISRLSE